MEKEMKIYHVETQEDYDDLMVKLENEGCMWSSGGCMWPSGDKPTDLKLWYEFEAETVIYLGSWRKGELTRGDLSEAKSKYPTIPIIKHKAKGAKQMEKVVVPQFVADWYESNKKGYSLYGLLHSFAEDYYLLPGLQEWVKDYNLKENDAQDILAKMYLFQDYEIEVEEEKKYYWRKKKEYSFNFEHHCSNNYLNLDVDGRLFFSDKAEFSLCTTKFTETKLRELVSEEDFNKLERVEIDDVQ